jgi:hypothetical protein
MEFSLYDSVGWEALYSFVIEFEIRINRSWLIGMCSNETSSKVRVDKYLSDTFSIQYGL